MLRTIHSTIPAAEHTTMLRRCSMARCLSKVMTGIDHSMWTNLPPPMIALRTVGTTSTVINDVGELIALCEQARCGVNGKTVMDLSVRKTLRVGADRVSVEWPAMGAAVTDCAAHLGLGAGVTAQLHDVLVYRPGDFFKRHVDAIKHPRHCATMVVDTGLAVGRCVGGVLHVGDTPWVSCGAGSYAAWHTNAEHHVTELVSGHRVVAMYDLLRSEPGVSQSTPETPVAPAKQTVQLTDKNEVAVLMKYLQENAVAFGKEFTEADLSKADDLFETYAAKRGDGDPAVVEECSKARALRWNATCEKPWDADKDTPQEFVGFWLVRQYPSNEGIVRNSMLNGADADLVEAIARKFGVPLGHIECRVVYKYESGRDAEGEDAWNVCADRVEGVDDDPRDEYCVATSAEDEQEASLKEKKRNISLAGGVRNYSEGNPPDDYDSLYGDEYRRVAIVGGTRQSKREPCGEIVGNEGPEPIYRYRDTYLYFHVKYLKDYLARQATAGDATGQCGVSR